MTNLCPLKNLKDLLPVGCLGEGGDVKADPLRHVEFALAFLLLLRRLKLLD